MMIMREPSRFNSASYSCSLELIIRPGFSARNPASSRREPTILGQARKPLMLKTVHRRRQSRGNSPIAYDISIDTPDVEIVAVHAISRAGRDEEQRRPIRREPGIGLDTIAREDRLLWLSPAAAAAGRDEDPPVLEGRCTSNEVEIPGSGVERRMRLELVARHAERLPGLDGPGVPVTHAAQATKALNATARARIGSVERDITRSSPHRARCLVPGTESRRSPASVSSRRPCATRHAG